MLVIRSNKELHETFHSLRKDDVVCCRIATKIGEEPILTTLLERGIHLIPSGTSQLASRSKVFQTRLFGDLMIDGTRAIHHRQDLEAVCELLNNIDRGAWVCKEDRKDAGLGIHLLDSAAALRGLLGKRVLSYPFVVQPYLTPVKDVRVIILDDHTEAYQRLNPGHWKQNLRSGASARACQLSKEQLALCKAVMKRGKFPYAHIDLLEDATGKNWLLEVNLRGGLKGAKLNGREYAEKTTVIHERLLNKHRSKCQTRGN
jgi:ribosomal protein S6--L-glutamate ligase